MRLLNIACDPNYMFSIDNHRMTIIEVDGVNHHPVEVNAVQIFSGQRYSFIVRPNRLHKWLSAEHSFSARRKPARGELLGPRTCRFPTKPAEASWFRRRNQLGHPSLCRCVTGGSSITTATVYRPTIGDRLTPADTSRCGRPRLSRRLDGLLIVFTAWKALPGWCR